MIEKNHFLNALLILPLLVLLLFTGCQDTGSDNATADRETTTVDIGALIPLTGAAASNGIGMYTALQIAEEDMNETLERQNSGKRVRLVYADTESDSQKVDTLLHAFLNQGIRLIIGPMTSEELLAVETTINDSNSLMISPSSTLSTLAVEDDNIYRFISDDSSEVNALVAKLEDEGIRNLAVFYRNDSWGASLAHNVMVAFEANGGDIIASEGYTGLRQSAIQDLLNNMSTVISEAETTVDASTIGFQVICFDEGDGIMGDAAAYADLQGIKWFGSDGFVRLDIAAAGETSAQFAVQTQYTAPIFGVELTTMGQTLQSKIEDRLGSTINIYPLISYDAFMIAANTLLAVGDETTLVDLRIRFLSETVAYDGAVGPIALNAAGDMADGSYYFWNYTQQDGEYVWQHTMTYSDGRISPAGQSSVFSSSKQIKSLKVLR